VDELFPVAEAMQLLRLADVEGGDIKLTHMGKRFADSELNERKEIFSRALIARCRWRPISAECWMSGPAIPPPRAASWTSWKIIWPRILQRRLEDHRLLARFGELFSYDDDGAMFSLENPT